MKKLLQGVTGLFGFAFAGFALALPPDVSAITGAVDYSTIIAGILSVAGLIAAVAVTIKGSIMMLAFLRRG